MREREQRGADGVRRPPDDAPMLDRAREEGARDEHCREGESQRPDRAREEDDAERGRKEDRRGSARVPAGHAATEPVDGDGRHHGGGDRGKADPVLRVVPRDDRLEEREVARTRGIVGEPALDDVRERSLRRSDGYRLPRVERPPTERDGAEHESQAGTEVRQDPVQQSQHARLEGDPRRCGRRRVGRGAHPEPRVAAASAGARTARPCDPRPRDASASEVERPLRRPARAAPGARRPWTAQLRAHPEHWAAAYRMTWRPWGSVV
jgi:hypothetical protein